ncbi:MAG: hypothetical protein QM755_13320 [Luteolibacter sp.]
MTSTSCRQEKETKEESGSKAQDSTARRRSATPSAKTRLTELGGGKFKVVEGDLFEAGSSGPVTVKRDEAPALVIKATRIEKRADGSMFLVAPVEVTLPVGDPHTIETGGMIIKSDGTMSREGTPGPNELKASRTLPSVPILPPRPPVSGENGKQEDH